MLTTQPGLGHECNNMEGAILKTHGCPRKSTKPIPDVGKDRQASGEGDMVSL